MDSTYKSLSRPSLVEFLNSQWIARGDESKALFIVDVNNIRSIDAYHGPDYSVGMIEAAGKALSALLRANDQAFLLGDRRFVLLLDPVSNIDHCSLAVHRILKLFEEEIPVLDKQLRCNVRIGVAVSPDHSRDPNHLLQYAEIALDRANELKKSWCFYEQGFIDRLVNQTMLEDELLRSIRQDELSMVYQPQYQIESGKIAGAEALVRWHSTKHGSISPDVFIPIAENNGFIEDLSEWIVNTVMRQCRSLIRSNPDFSVSINVSTPLLDSNYFAEFIARASALWGFPIEQLVVEITESIMMQNPDSAIGSLRRLRMSGARVAMDDFGTGFSSLAYLKQLPIQELKIDKSFLSNLSTHDDNWKIVQSVVDLAKRFGLETVAEGVETEQTLRLMNSLGVDRAQGFLIGRPGTIEELITLVNSRHRRTG